MKIFVCIDDTDKLLGRGTGELASMLAEGLEKNCGGKSYFVSRHQLLVHPDIPYTSHNSSMCFAADMEQANLDRFIGYASKFLEEERAEGSDPGLCVARVDNPDSLSHLIEFGQAAKRQVLTKKEAYDLASQSGVHLSEHGGTGGGVIGALAGVGLRLSGNDGRLRGKLVVGFHNLAVKASTIRSHDLIDAVRSISGEEAPEDDELVRLGLKIKAVLLEGKNILLVAPVEPPIIGGIRWRTCIKEELKDY